MTQEACLKRARRYLEILSRTSFATKLPNKDDRDDVIQMAMIRISKSWQQYAGERWQLYVYVVMQNQCASWHSQNKRWQKSIATLNTAIENYNDKNYDLIEVESILEEFATDDPSRETLRQRLRRHLEL